MSSWSLSKTSLIKIIDRGVNRRMIKGSGESLRLLCFLMRPERVWFSNLLEGELDDTKGFD